MIVERYSEKVCGVKMGSTFQNHLVRRYGKINGDVRKTLILIHFLMVS